VKYEAIKGGLRVAKIPGGYAVLHEDSKLPAIQYLRQRRFAEQARTELLATGVDFTKDKRIVQAARERWQEVYYRWYNRTHALGDNVPGLDPETFEHYPESTSYSQLIPSAAQAAEMRDLAAMLRERGRIEAAEVEESIPYLFQFERAGVAIHDGDTWIWAGAAA
jgi:hypothetical protein